MENIILMIFLGFQVCEQLELDQPTPSAYQIRYAGCKGMLSIDKRLDKNQQGPQLILRDSMKKFDSDQSCVLEVVKYSQPSKRNKKISFESQHQYNAPTHHI